MNLAELAKILGGRVEGDDKVSIRAVASLEDAGSEAISFLSDNRYLPILANSKAGAVMVSEDFDGQAAVSLLRVKDVDDALEKVLELFSPGADIPEEGIDPSAMVSSSARIEKTVHVGAHVVIGDRVTVGKDTAILPGCVIGRDVKIGKDCILGANVVINQHCSLGNRVMIHPNSTIGADGFGYRLVNGRHRKVPHVGTVVIEDDVEIGANSCVDRAKFGRTVIGQGTKIDNMVQIGHNVSVGHDCVIVSQCGLAGSVKLGHHVVLGGQSGIAEHVRVADGVNAAAGSGIIKDVEPGRKIGGYPARDLREYFRDMAHVRRLWKLTKEVEHLRVLVEAHVGTTDHPA